MITLLELTKSVETAVTESRAAHGSLDLVNTLPLLSRRPVVLVSILMLSGIIRFVSFVLLISIFSRPFPIPQVNNDDN